ncbi:hypothetical protein SD10_18570 [Spirosoma radiotolerans]|uniref:Cell division protein FtsX n=2 Tax=Spirosoma radiotolerans TaxID=1379870 RepID=A0A0E4A1K3_9BACT|nr:hypothetical protein SD10_18570 [Spirosoma radiotolerans]
MIRNYLKIALRNLVRSKTYSAINIGGLSLGLAAVMFILLFVEDEVSYDRFHKHGNQLYRVVLNSTTPEGREVRTGSTGTPEGPTFDQELPEVAGFCRMVGYEMLVRKQNEGIYEQVMYVDTSFFRLFSFELLAGGTTPQTLLNDPGSVVITDDMARKYFGTTQVIGRLLTIDAGGSFDNYRITGVVKSPPKNSSIQFDVLRPFVASLPPDYKTRRAQWAEGSLNTFVLLQAQTDEDGATGQATDPALTERKMASVFETHARAQLDQLSREYGNASVTYHLQPFTDMHLDDRYDMSNGLVQASSSIYSYILSGIAGLILLLAGINFVNLTLARSLRRTKEIGIRKVTGSTRQQLIGQFIGEAFLLTFLAFVPAVLVVYMLLPQFSTLANKALQLGFLASPKTLLLFGSLLLVVTLLAGFYPAFALSGFNPTQILYSRLRLGGRNGLGKSLVILQFMIATVLLIGTVVLHSQFEYIQTANVGYERANRVRIYVPWGRERQGELLKQVLRPEPGIEAVARKSGGHQKRTIYIRNKPVTTATEWIDDQYLRFVNVPVVAGRALNLANPADSLSNILVNETFARQFFTANQSAIGQVVQRKGDDNSNHDLTVVGVVRDYQYRSLRDKPEPVLLQLGKPEQMNQLYVKLTPHQTKAALATIESQFNKLIPYQPFSFHFMEDDRLADYADDARWKQLITYAAMLAIFIAGLGLFGLVSLAIEQRIKEIGIRKVLGADLITIARMLSMSYLKLVALAFVIAAPVGWYAARYWLDTFAYRIDLSGWLFGLVGLSVLGVALLTVSFQSVKAGLMNPVKSLRSE